MSSRSVQNYNLWYRIQIYIKFIQNFRFLRLQGKSYVLATFGSYEKMIQQKLGLSAPTTIEKKIKELRDGTSILASDGLTNAIQSCYKAAWLQLSNKQKDLILKSTAIALKLNVNELRTKLEKETMINT